MRSKTPLALMEQAIMVLVFALAAALCLRVFVWSDQTSKRSEARDRAVLEAQTAAELIKHAGETQSDVDTVLSGVAEEMGGTSEQGKLTVTYDSGWTPTAGAENFVLTAETADSGVSGLNMVHIAVTRPLPSDAAQQDELFAIDAAWQGEVD